MTLTWVYYNKCHEIFYRGQDRERGIIETGIDGESNFDAKEQLENVKIARKGKDQHIDDAEVDDQDTPDDNTVSKRPTMD